MNAALSNYLFATPWWLPTLLAAVGLYVAWQGNKRQERRVISAGLGLVVLAVTVSVVSYLVETDVEKVTRQSRKAVQAFVDQDWATLRSLMDPRVRLQVASITVYESRDDLIDAAKAARTRDRLSSLTVTSVDASQTSTYITVQLSIISTQEATLGRPLPSDWQFDWQKVGNEWLLMEVTPQRLANLDASQIRELMPRAQQ